MGQTLSDTDKPKAKIADVINVERHGDALILPDGMSLDRVDAAIHAKMKYDEQTVAINAVFDAFVLDAANALHEVLKVRFGWAQSVTKITETMFGEKKEPPTMVTVPTGPDTSVQVPWGRFELLGIDGYLETSITQKERGGRGFFVLTGEVKRKDEEKINEIVADVRKYIREHSLFKGKAFRLRLRDEGGEYKPLPEPVFMDTRNHAILDELTFSDEVDEQIRVNLFEPILSTAACRDEKVPLKRGILLAGPFGTGKSMTATCTSIIAVDNGWTFVSVERAAELADILRLSREWGPVVVFCEDIDQVMSGERTVSMDEVLNVIDGIESKFTELMVVLTTNHLEKIHQGMLRPGRLDAVIMVNPPDAKAAERLVRLYARGRIEEHEDLTTVAGMLDGQKPAIIREVVEKSKVAAIRVRRLLGKEDQPLTLTGPALVASARQMKTQIDLLEEKEPDKRSEVVKAAQITADAIRDAGVPILPPYMRQAEAKDFLTGEITVAKVNDAVRLSLESSGETDD